MLGSQNVQRWMTAAIRLVLLLALTTLSDTGTGAGNPGVSPVVRGVNGQPVAPGALTVSLTGLGPNEPAHVRLYALIADRATVLAERDGLGALTFPGLAAGAYWVLGDAPGKARASTMVVLYTDVRAVSLAFEGEHVLSVRVVGEDGAGIAHAEIEVTGREPLPVGARADREGRARMGRLSSGPYSVTARSPALDGATVRDVKESPNGEVVVVLKKLGALRVTVTDGAGKPAPHAEVWIVGAGLWPPRRTETDEVGTVRIAGLPPGSYAAKAILGQRTSSVNYDIDVARGEERALALALGKGEEIALHVVDDDDPTRGVDGARVTFVEDGVSAFPMEAVTGRDGRARIGPVPRSSGTLSIVADGFVPATVTATEHEIRLARSGTLRGTVKDARGFFVDGAMLEVIGTDVHGQPIDEEPERRAFQTSLFQSGLATPRALISAGELGVMPGPVPPIPRAGSAVAPTRTIPASDRWITRERGTFVLHPVTPGRVRVVVRHPEYVEAVSELVTLDAASDREVDIVLHRGGMLDGKIVDAQERPVAGAEVRVVDLHGSMDRFEKSATDGTFAFASLPTEILVSVTPHGTMVEAARVEVHVKEGETEHITLRLPEPRESTTLRVTDERGFPVSMAQVVALSLDPGVPLKATVFTDRDGSATLNSTFGLPLRLEASAPQLAALSMQVAAAGKEVRVVLSHGLDVQGEVRSDRGFPLEKVEIAIYTQSAVLRSLTDSGGEFTLNRVPAGPAHLRASRDGYAPLERTLDLIAGRALKIPRLELEREAIVEGRVIDSEGRPVRGAKIAKDHVPTYVPSGAPPAGVVISDKDGAFALGRLPSGLLSLEALETDLGRGSVAIELRRGDTLKGITIALKKEGHVTEALARGALAITMKMDAEGHIVVIDVASGSTAERGGIVPGDHILTVDGKAITTLDEARDAIAGSPKTEAYLEVQRGTSREKLRIEREELRR